MKKLICLALALTMICAIGVTSFAANSTGGNTTIDTTIPVTYTVTIPADTTIAFEAQSTVLGNIAVIESRIEAGGEITVSATTDGILSCGDSEIAYVIMNGESAFAPVDFITEGSVSLDIAIAAEDWDNAPDAGYYIDIITFEVAYTQPIT